MPPNFTFTVFIIHGDLRRVQSSSFHQVWGSLNHCILVDMISHTMFGNNWWPFCILMALLKSNPYLTNMIVFANFDQYVFPSH